uniref:F-box domain-containing protein n=1 Tax=Chenopodium quinoa TaxID=63459 RepID=A0A803L8H5_CHEQI
MMKTKEEEEKTISPSKIGCYMPEDLITEMLLRLPVKSPVRFKSVCKDWSSIISNPSFTKTQFHLSSRVADLKPIYSSIEENQRKIATKINATSDGSLCVYLQYIGSFGWCIEPNPDVRRQLSNDALHWTLEVKKCQCHDIDYFDTIDHNRDDKEHFIFKFDMVNEVFERVADLKPIYSSTEKDKRIIAMKINATGDDSLCVYLQHNESSGYYYWPFIEARNPDDVDMWMITKSNTRKKSRLAGRCNNTGSNHEMVRITGNGNVIVFENRHYPNSMENLVIFDGRQPNKRFYIEATN